MSETATCEDCGEALASSKSRHTWHRRCQACHIKTLGGDTPVRVWSRETGVSLRQLADETEVPYRTVQRAAAGQPVEYETAEKLHARTDIDIGVLCKGAWPEEGA